jgi:hypothetical protein
MGIKEEKLLEMNQFLYGEMAKSSSTVVGEEDCGGEEMVWLKVACGGCCGNCLTLGWMVVSGSEIAGL